MTSIRGRLLAILLLATGLIWLAAVITMSPVWLDSEMPYWPSRETSPPALYVHRAAPAVGVFSQLVRLSASSPLRTTPLVQSCVALQALPDQEHTAAPVVA